MYNRQLFKQHLSQKVLNNPEQRRFFEVTNNPAFDCSGVVADVCVDGEYPRSVHLR